MKIVTPIRSKKTKFNKSCLLREDTSSYKNDMAGLCFGKDTAGWLESKVNPTDSITFSNDKDDDFNLRYAFASFSFDDWIWVGKYMGWLK